MASAARGYEEHPTQVSKSTTLEAPPWSGPVRLVVLNGIGRGQVFAVEATDLIIGRGSDADVKVDGPQISRKHARIRRMQSGIFTVEGRLSIGDRMCRAWIVILPIWARGLRRELLSSDRFSWHGMRS